MADLEDKDRPFRILAREDHRLSTCVQCGFCLPVCPTYTRLGDEADSPRGRIRLMRAVAEERLPASDPMFRKHIDRCLGCRACESACPPGVEFGLLVERARTVIDMSSPERPPPSARLLLAMVRSRVWTRIVSALLRLVRGVGLSSVVVRKAPRRLYRLRLASAMLEATGASSALTTERGDDSLPAARVNPHPVAKRVAILAGCVQDGLMRPINEATARVLAVNGFDVHEVRGQGCCGALHVHSGDIEVARQLARANIAAFELADIEVVVANAAGCGAAMKEYGALFEDDSEWAARARAFSARVKDVSEVLVENGVVPGARVDMCVTYDAPCHLLHAQRVARAPLEMVASVPGIELRALRDADQCCGGAGTWGLQHADLARRILDDKLDAIAETGAAAVLTPNAGCIMQIGAGLIERSSSVRVLHPIQLLDESYRRAGFYRAYTR